MEWSKYTISHWVANKEIFLRFSSLCLTTVNDPIGPMTSLGIVTKEFYTLYIKTATVPVFNMHIGVFSNINQDIYLVRIMYYVDGDIRGFC